VWDRLQNSAYRSEAAFGKPRVGSLRPRLRAQRARPLLPRHAQSTYEVPADEWLRVPVPALVSEELFEAVPPPLEVSISAQK
jgi:site-specific DNA recombinase